MDKKILTFLGLVIVLIIGSYFVQEGFVDASGNRDTSGNTINISLADLFSLFATTSSTSSSSSSSSSSNRSSDTKLTEDEKEDEKEDESTLESQFETLKKQLAKDVRDTVRSELQKQEEGSVLNDSCIDSIANQQGTDWMRYIPGKNPADYIRKDSIPCWGCSVK